MAAKLLVATRKGLFIWEQDCGKWEIKQTAFLGDHVSFVLGDKRDGWLYAALNHGHFGVKLHRSADGGAHWEECAVPQYPTKPPEAEAEIMEMSGKPFPWDLKMIWSLAAGGANQPGKLWCGTVPGGLFVSEDRGSSWELVRSLWDRPERPKWFGGGLDYPGIHSLCLHPQNPDHLTLAISCGGVWTTTDGGKSFEVIGGGIHSDYAPPEHRYNPNIQDVHLMVQCPAQPEVLWAQHHNGIFRSTDGGRNFTFIDTAQPSWFGFAVAVHPTDPDTGRFLPAIKDERRIPVDGPVVVSRTQDGGRTFEVLLEGLPQHHAYDLFFRHSLSVDSTGTHLLIGSTTGSLWHSPTSGTTWTPLSQHLPPIYSLQYFEHP